jgi:hypothetical protein
MGGASVEHWETGNIWEVSLKKKERSFGINVHI